ncbi:MAG: hypothetical protein IKZ84_15585, partial [Victivallales bacterium]|nr:hypothetical protein [Victivallales bacterium]
IIKNAFLQQNSFDDIDMYCSPAKQTWMLRLLSTFISRTRNLIKKGVTLAEINDIPALPRLLRMKSEIKNDDKAAMADLERQINSALSAIEEKH